MFLKCDIPAVILRNIAELVQPFVEDRVTPADIEKALQQYQRPMLTVAEFAARAKCSTKTIYRAIEAGRINVVSVGKRSYRIPATELNTYIQGEQDDD